MAGPAENTGEPITLAEQEQADYALRELTRSERASEALRVPSAELRKVQPFFELGWVLGVRTGHTGPAMADVPVDRRTVARAFDRLMSERYVADRLLITGVEVSQQAAPSLWQRVGYHGSLRHRHGTYWVGGIHAYAVPGGWSELRYDLCEERGGRLVTVVSNARRASLTPLQEYRAAV
jgi:hypothetical protein